ncbi:gene transfer agent family protein [Loktanella sp. S4079]|uniref:gene transfer agent family protein n=1 Tax=Loktanella sp. S4079 TaxID=579483 RepID=UPI0005FA4B1B|nr:gene transfer agent family protein [Loktanella sp. S4079]KJZ20327.1 gene transfer agent protein [Loktanella sp. S4079]
MANPWTGEAEVRIDGVAYTCKLTLGALAELEANLGEGSLIDLIRRFEGGAFSSRDVMAVIVAGLRGAGWEGTSEDLMTAEIAGGPVGAAQLAATLLARAFAMPT